MERDESVPLSFERREEAGSMPQAAGWQERHADVAAVIDVTGMISDLEAARRGAG